MSVDVSSIILASSFCIKYIIISTLQSVGTGPRMASVAQPFLAVLLGFTFNPLPSLCLLFFPAMRVDELSFNLPPELIAQRPLDRRDASRLLLLNRFAGTFEDSSFSLMPTFLRGNELLVFNNARVLPARLFGLRLDTRPHKKSPGGEPQPLPQPLQGHV